MTRNDTATAGDDLPDEHGITWRMRRALYDVVATYGDSSVTLVAERAYLAMRDLDPVFDQKVVAAIRRAKARREL